MEEEWVSLAEFGFSNYEVSSLGYIRNIETGRKTLGAKHSSGYRRGTMTNDRKEVKQILIHVLVCKAFYGDPPDSSYTVDHIDRQKDNNNKNNLRWASRTEQRNNQKRSEGTKSYSNAITQILQDGTEFFTWFKIKDAASYIGLVKSNLKKVCENGGNYGGFKWKYANGNIPGEVWAPVKIPGSEPIAVSNMGRYKKINGKIGFGSTSQAGYKNLSFKIDGVRKTMFMHVLIALAFIGNNDKDVVNHKDGNKRNNKLDNLEYMTYSENTKHAIKEGLTVYKNTNRSNSRPIYQLNESGEIIKEFPSAREASRELGISSGNITTVLKGKRPRAGGFKWKYKD